MCVSLFLFGSLVLLNSLFKSLLNQIFRLHPLLDFVTLA